MKLHTLGPGNYTYLGSRLHTLGPGSYTYLGSRLHRPGPGSIMLGHCQGSSYTWARSYMDWGSTSHRPRKRRAISAPSTSTSASISESGSSYTWARSSARESSNIKGSWARRLRPGRYNSEARQLLLLGWDVHFRIGLEALQPRRGMRLRTLGPGSCVCLGSRLHRLGPYIAPSV